MKPYRRGLIKRANVKFHYGLKQRSHIGLSHPEKIKALSCLVQIFKGRMLFLRRMLFSKEAECYTLGV